MALIYRTNGYIETVEPKDGYDFRLEELQKIVGGFIEIIRIDDVRTMVVNEEGKLNGSELNPQATKIYRSAIGGYDVIVGDALLCYSEQVK